MATYQQHPALLGRSPSFDEEDDYSTDYSYSQTSFHSSMTGSFRDDSVGDLSPDSVVRKPLKPFGGSNNSNATVFNSLSTMGLAGLNSNRKSSMPFALHSPGTKAKKKADIDRAKRTIERLNQAEMQLKMKYNMDGKDKKKKSTKPNKHEDAELKLKLSQIDIARNFYQRRINQNFVAGPVPMEILNIVKSVSAPPSSQKPTSSREMV